MFDQTGGLFFWNPCENGFIELIWIDYSLRPRLVYNSTIAVRSMAFISVFLYMFVSMAVQSHLSAK